MPSWCGQLNFFMFYGSINMFSKAQKVTRYWNTWLKPHIWLYSSDQCMVLPHEHFPLHNPTKMCAVLIFIMYTTCFILFFKNQGFSKHFMKNCENITQLHYIFIISFCHLQEFMWDIASVIPNIQKHMVSVEHLYKNETFRQLSKNS